MRKLLPLDAAVETGNREFLDWFLKDNPRSFPSVSTLVPSLIKSQSTAMLRWAIERTQTEEKAIGKAGTGRSFDSKTYFPLLAQAGRTDLLEQAGILLGQLPGAVIDHVQALLTGVRAGHLNVFDWIVRRFKVDLASMQPSFWQKLLNAACEGRCPSLVQLALEKGVAVRAKHLLIPVSSPHHPEDAIPILRLLLSRYNLQELEEEYVKEEFLSGAIGPSTFLPAFQLLVDAGCAVNGHRLLDAIYAKRLDLCKFIVHRNPSSLPGLSPTMLVNALSAAAPREARWLLRNLPPAFSTPEFRGTLAWVNLSCVDPETLFLLSRRLPLQSLIPTIFSVNGLPSLSILHSLHITIPPSDLRRCFAAAWKPWGRSESLEDDTLMDFAIQMSTKEGLVEAGLIKANDPWPPGSSDELERVLVRIRTCLPSPPRSSRAPRSSFSSIQHRAHLITCLIDSSQGHLRPREAREDANEGRPINVYY